MKKVWHKDLGFCVVTCETGTHLGLAKENGDLRVSTLVNKNEVEDQCLEFKINDIVVYNAKRWRIMGYEPSTNRVIVALVRKDGSIHAVERFAIKPSKFKEIKSHQLRMAMIDEDGNIVQVMGEI